MTNLLFWILFNIAGQAVNTPPANPPAINNQALNSFMHMGRVLDSRQQPVSEAQVTVYLLQNWRSSAVKDGCIDVQAIRVLQRQPYPLKLIYQTNTDNQGLFMVQTNLPPTWDLEKLFVVVRKPGYAVAGRLLVDVGDDAESAIYLEPPARIAGRVVDEQGRPVDGVQVHAVLLQTKEKQRYYIIDHYTNLIRALAGTDALTSVTDGRGRFIFEQIPQSAQIEFMVDDPEKRYHSLVSWNPEENLDEQGQYEAGAQDIVLTVVRLNSIIIGQVRNLETGAALDQVHIRINSRSFDRRNFFYATRTTDDTGRFIVRCIPGSYTLNAEALRKADRGPFIIPPKSVQVTAEQTAEVTFWADPAAILHVKVYDQDNHRPIRGVEVNITCLANQQSYHSETNNDGLSRFIVPRGTYKLTGIKLDGYEDLKIGQELRLDKGQKYTIEQAYKLVKPDRTITLQVVDQQDNPLAGVQIFTVVADSPVFITDADGLAKIPEEDYRRYPKTTADQVENIHWRRTYFFVRQEEKNLAAFVHIPSKPGILRIVLKDGYEISGKVTDTAGNPIPDADVLLDSYFPKSSFSRTHYNLLATKTDSAGTYSFRGLPHRHSYLVAAVADSYGCEEEEIHFLESRKNPFPEYGIRPNRMARSSQPQASNPSIREGEDKVVLDDLVLPPANLTITGRILDILGKPQPARIVITDSTLADSASFQTDANGYFQVSGLAAGKIHLTITPFNDDFQETYVQVQVSDQPFTIILSPENTKQFKIPEASPAYGLALVRLVHKEDKTPMINTTVYFRGKSFCNIVACKTDKNGLAWLAVPAGEFWIATIASSLTHESANPAEHWQAVAGQTVQIEISLPHRPSISGMILDESGQPISGALLQLQPNAKIMGHKRRYITKADGRFKFFWQAFSLPKDQLDLSSHHIYLLISHERRNLAAILRITSLKVDDIQITLSPACRIAGTISTSEGKPLQARIRLQNIISKQDQCAFLCKSEYYYSDANGNYEIKGLPQLPPGFSYNLAYSDRGARHTINVHIPSEKLLPGTITVDVILGKKAYIDGVPYIHRY